MIAHLRMVEVVGGRGNQVYCQSDRRRINNPACGSRTPVAPRLLILSATSGRASQIHAEGVRTAIQKRDMSPPLTLSNELKGLTFVPAQDYSSMP